MMKNLLTALLVMISLAASAQQNTLLAQSFWRSTPDINAVKAEVAKGNNPAQSNAMAMDPVVMAINAGASTATIDYLLEQPGNSVDKPTHDGRTYLHWAAMRGNTEVMEHLLAKGAKVNVIDSHGTTPLTTAAAGGQTNIRIYDLLLSHGDNLKTNLNEDGANALLLAIGNDTDFSLTNYFISKGLDIKSVDKNGNNAFAYAAKSGNIEQMKAVLEKGVPVSQQAVLMAAQGGGSRRGGFSGPGAQGGNQVASGGSNSLAVYQYLERLGIKPNMVNATGQNVLHYLVRKQGQTETIKYFINKGVDVNKPDEDGLTPLMNAATGSRDTAVFNLLVPKVKNINQITPQGQTALTFAVKSNGPQVIDYLIAKGADVKVLDRKGNNLAFYAIEGYGAGGGRQFGGAKPEDLDAKLNLLKAKGLNVTAPQQNGNTLYHLAVAKNNLALIQHIQTYGIDVNAKNKEGFTPLHKAAMIAQNDEILKYLLSIGAKKEIGTGFNETAYDLASANETLTKSNVSVNFLK